MDRPKKKYFILAVAAIVNFVHGNPYIWTVFQPYVRQEYGLSVAESSQPFTIIIGIFAAGNILGGFLQHRIGARATILAGSLLMCTGFFLAGMAPYQMPWLISAGYGVLGGLGSGCAFAMLVAVPQAWFPDRRGLVTGITIGVVGISGVIMNPLCDVMLRARGYRFSMLVVTAIYAVLSLGGLFITEPKGEDAGKINPLLESKKQYSTREMMRTKSYYLLSISMALGVPAYVLVNPLMKSLGMERGLSGNAALWCVVIASAANIAGRFAAPWISDKFGCRQVIQVLFLIAMVAVTGLTIARGGLFVLLASLISLTYGGFVSAYPVLTADCFGMKYQGMNFGAVMIGYGVVSILCPYLISFAEQTPLGLGLAFLFAGAACCLGLFVTTAIHKDITGEGKEG